MAAVISMLRAVNVGGHSKIRMEALRALYGRLGFQDAQSYVQSGNVVFRTSGRDLSRVARKIEEGIAKEFACKPDVILRTTAEMRDVVSRNPFAGRAGIEPGKLLVTFLASEPGPEARERFSRIEADPEELHLDGRELYIYFPIGIGKSKLPVGRIERALMTPGTGRNWNTVTKLLEMAEGLEASR